MISKIATASIEVTFDSDPNMIIVHKRWICESPAWGYSYGGILSPITNFQKWPFTIQSNGPFHKSYKKL